MGESEHLTLTEAVALFSDEDAVERLFTEARWPNGIACPKCGSLTVRVFDSERRPTRYRCQDCLAFFNVKTDSVMQGSKLPLSKWALAIYLLITSNKGVSSVQLAAILLMSLIGSACGDLPATSPETCEELAPRIIKLSKENENPFSGRILNLYDIESLESDGDNILKCGARATRSRGGERDIFFYLKEDEDSDRFIGYEGQ